MAPYGYIYYLLVGMGVKLFGLQLWFGRLLTICCALVCLWSVKKIVFALTNNKEASHIGCLTVVSLYAVQSTIAVQRPDFISLAFALLALQFAFRDGNKLLILLFLCLAFFSKQTIILPIGIAAILFWQEGTRSKAVLFFVLTILLCGLGMFLLNVTSDGGYYWQHFTHAGRLPFSIIRTRIILEAVLKSPSTLVVLACLLITAFYMGKSLLKVFRPVEIFNKGFSKQETTVIYLLISIAFVLITSARHGASGNYYLEISFVVSIVFALAFDWLRQNQKEKLATVFLLLMIFGGAFQFARFVRGEYFRWKSVLYYREMVETVDKLTPPNSFCISVYPEIVTASGRHFHFDDWAEYTKGYSPELREVFQKEISTMRYSAIILSTDTAEKELKGYRFVKMQTPVPEKVYTAYLYVRDETKK